MIDDASFLLVKMFTHYCDPYYTCKIHEKLCQKCPAEDGCSHARRHKKFGGIQLIRSNSV